MSAPSPFFGYAAQVWAEVTASVSYLMSVLTPGTPTNVAATVDDVVLANCINGLGAINANNLLQAWQAELQNLQAIQALPITIDPTSLSVLNNRAAALQAAIVALRPLIVQPPFPSVATSIALGNPSITDPGLLTFYENFNLETPPAGTTAANIQAQAQLIATSFSNIATAIQVLQGNFLTQAYDTAERMAQVAQIVANTISNFSSGSISSNLPISQIWNTIVTLPSFTIDAAIINGAPYSLASQQSAVIRNAILTLIQQIELFVLILDQPVTSNVNLASLSSGDNLMDLAARVLGDFEQWTDIANLNQLQPPYVSATPAPGLASPGQQLFMPQPGSQTTPLGAPPNYAINFLGVDLFIGPINGLMPPWTGDFQTIAGYSNLAISLGRRLQTPLGTLIFHSDFGSRIPPEVGAVQTQDTTGRISAFGKSALRSDPRVQAVLSATATLRPNGQVAFAGSVQPAGFGTQPVSVNEVLGSVQ